LGAAQKDAAETVAEPVPMQLRNAPTKLMKQFGYSEGYEHAHNVEGGVPTMDCLPESMKGRRYYYPTDRGVEKRIAERLEEIRKLRQNSEE